MSNYDNIRPYAEFAHIAAQHGGPDKYLNMLAAQNRQIGLHSAVWQGTIMPMAVLAICGLGKTIYQRHRENQYRKEVERYRFTPFYQYGDIYQDRRDVIVRNPNLQGVKYIEGEVVDNCDWMLGMF